MEAGDKGITEEVKKGSKPADVLNPGKTVLGAATQIGAATLTPGANTLGIAAAAIGSLADSKVGAAATTIIGVTDTIKGYQQAAAKTIASSGNFLSSITNTKGGMEQLNATILTASHRSSELGEGMGTIISGAATLASHSNNLAAGYNTQSGAIGRNADALTKYNAIQQQAADLFSTGRQVGIDYQTMLQGSISSYDNLGMSAREYADSVAYLSDQTKNTGVSTGNLMGTLTNLSGSYKYLNFDINNVGTSLAAVATAQKEGKLLYKSEQSMLETNTQAYKAASSAANDAGKSAFYAHAATGETGMAARLKFAMASETEQQQMMIETVKGQTGGKFYSQKEFKEGKVDATQYGVQVQRVADTFGMSFDQAIQFAEQLAQGLTPKQAKSKIEQQKKAAEKGIETIQADKTTIDKIGTSQQKSEKAFQLQATKTMVGTGTAPGVIESVDKTFAQLTPTLQGFGGVVGDLAESLSTWNTEIMQLVSDLKIQEGINLPTPKAPSSGALKTSTTTPAGVSVPSTSSTMKSITTPPATGAMLQPSPLAPAPTAAIQIPPVIQQPPIAAINAQTNATIATLSIPSATTQPPIVSSESTVTTTSSSGTSGEAPTINVKLVLNGREVAQALMNTTELQKAVDNAISKNKANTYSGKNTGKSSQT